MATARALHPPRLSLELRDDSGLLLSSELVDTAELGWPAEAGERVLLYSVERLPLADGRFHLRLGLTDAAGHVLHWLGDALTFVVYPGGEERGVLRLDGQWSMQETGATAEIPRR